MDRLCECHMCVAVGTSASLSLSLSHTDTPSEQLCAAHNTTLCATGCGWVGVWWRVCEEYWYHFLSFHFSVLPLCLFSFFKSSVSVLGEATRPSCQPCPSETHPPQPELQPCPSETHPPQPELQPRGIPGSYSTEVTVTNQIRLICRALFSFTSDVTEGFTYAHRPAPEPTSTPQERRGKRIKNGKKDWEEQFSELG